MLLKTAKEGTPRQRVTAEARLLDLKKEQLFGAKGLSEKEYKQKLAYEMRVASSKAPPGSWTEYGKVLGPEPTKAEVETEYQNRLQHTLIIGKEINNGMAKLQKSMDTMNETLQRQKGSDVKGSSMGDSFGVGDPLLSGLNTGQLILGN